MKGRRDKGKKPRLDWTMRRERETREGKERDTLGQEPKKGWPPPLS